MSSEIRVLVVDDEPGIRDLMAHELGGLGYPVVTAGDGEAALEIARREPFHVVVTDIKMPRMDGLALLVALKQIDPDIEVVVTTGYGTIDMAVAAMKQGAYDFIQKPFPVEVLQHTIERALESRRLRSLLALYESSRIVFSTVRLDALLPLIAEIARASLQADDASILLREGDRLWLAASAGLEEDQRLQSRLALGERVAGRVAEMREPVILHGPLEQSAPFQDVPSLREIRSSIVHPLVMEDDLLGILCINRTANLDRFGARDLKHASILGAQVALAVRNARLVGRLEGKIAELDAANRSLRETQSQLGQAEKVAALGQLAAGVAHEMNAPLSSISSFAGGLLRGSGLGPVEQAQVRQIATQAQRCAGIIRSLVTFGQKEIPATQSVDIVPLVHETLEMVWYDLDRFRIEFRETVPQDLPPLFGDGFQLQQVLLNLVCYAIGSMESSPRKELEIRAEREGSRIHLAIRDTGRGIPDRLLEHLFEPFHPAHPKGREAGLGLYMAHEIVRQHGGAIRVRSREGEGTTFTLELPVARGEAATGGTKA
jgi:C4-dicarboxylate-specific signal transduction histidine kinase